MIRVNRWWYNDGHHGTVKCEGGHSACKGWMWERPGGGDYCKACAIREFNQKPPSLIDCAGWGWSRHMLKLRHS